jgi:hypothetical protein
MNPTGKSKTTLGPTGQVTGFKDEKGSSGARGAVSPSALGNIEINRQWARLNGYP